MLYLSEILLKNPTLENFQQLIDKVKDAAREGELFFSMDVKPQYPDSPHDWEDKLESAFNGSLD